MFKDMTDEEFAKAEADAEDCLWSPYACFARQVVGFRIIKDGEVIPKWDVWARLRDKPCQLERIIRGEHPDYKKRPNPEIDNQLWNQLELELPQGTEPMY